MKILVISVHPDDETLGCGGTILKHKSRGDDIFWLILTNTSGVAAFSQEFTAKREKEVELVSRAYNFKKTYRLGFPATQLQKLDLSEMIAKISVVIQEVKPETIYTVNRSDIHTDHQIAAKAVMSCTKSFTAPFVKRILMYECISQTEMAPALPENIFVAHVYSDISAFLDEKIKVMMIYGSEVRPAPFPRSIENIKALARFRGSTVSVQYAEAFMLLREVVC